MAFDRKSGAVQWKTGSHPPGYSSPIAITIGGLRQVITFTGNGVLAVAPDSGKVLWEKAWKTDYDVNAATPIFISPDQVFIASGYGVGGTLFQIVVADGKVKKVDERWQSKGMRNQFSSSVLHQGHLYGFDGKTFKCIDAGSGEERWATRGLGHGSLFYADGHLYVLSEGGDLLLVRATPESYQVKSSFTVGEGRYWSVPTLYEGHLYLRDQQSIQVFKVKA
jgi:outer membrane protein assembly factor BamB